MEIKKGLNASHIKELERLGFTPGEIEGFVKNFEKIKKLQGDREATMAKLAELTKAKEHKLAQLKATESALQSGKSSKQLEYMKTFESERDLAQKKEKIMQELNQVKIKYKDNPFIMDYLKKAEKGEMIELHNFYVPKGVPKGEATQLMKFSDYSKDLKPLDKLIGVNKDMKSVAKSRKELEETIQKTDKKWVDDVNKNQSELAKVEGEFAETTTNLRSINTELNDVNQVYYKFELEMQRRAESLTVWAERTRTVAKYLQWGGLAMGGLWVLTGKNPGQQMAYGAEAAATGAKVAGKGLHELYVADHSGTPALDVMIDDQVDGLKRQQDYRKMIEKAKGSEESVMAIGQRHIDDPEMQRELRERGLLEKVMEKMKDKGAQVAEDEGLGRVEYTASDAKKKLKEKV